MNEFKSIEKIITSIRIWMRKYNPIILYKYISILSIHPSNQIFQIRFEFLLAVMTAIRMEEYQNTSLDYEEFCKFILKFKSKTDSFFIEDFTPFSQLKLIPYFFEKEKFFYFYGHTERTYELLRILEKLYILKTDKTYPEQVLIKNIFLQVLRFQTKILKKLVRIEESQENIESQIYLPTLDFYKEFEDLIIIEDVEVFDSNFILEFSKNEIDLKNNFRNILDGDFFNSLYLRFSDSEFMLILPSTQIEMLFKIFEDVIRRSKNNELEILIQHNLRKTLRDVNSSFFHISSGIETILNGKKESFPYPLDDIILYENTLILFKAIDLFGKNNLQEKLSECYNYLEDYIQLIKHEEKIFLKLFGPYFFEVPTEEVRIVRIIVYESINLSPEIFQFNFGTNSQITVFRLMDLISIFELTSSPLSFLKFLEEKYSFGRIFTFDNINIFAAFHHNNESLPSYGDVRMIIDPHMWSHFYNNHLHNKFQDSIYELVELEFPTKFNKIQRWNNKQNVYDCIDNRSLETAIIIKLDELLIWIINPRIQPPLLHEDLEFQMNVISPLYADYISRIEIEFRSLIKSYFSTNRHAIHLVPIKICPNSSEFTRFKKYYQQITEEDPIIVKSFLNKYYQLITMVFYDYKKWGKKFVDSISNDNCIYAIWQLICSIIEYFEPDLANEDVNNKTMEFIRNYLKENERDYFIESVPARNLNIKNYPSYEQFNPTDRERVLKEVESYLRDNHYKQEHLSPEESLELFNKIYKIFYEKLRVLISQFDISILYHAYKQLELIEGKRYLLLLESGIKNSTKLDNGYRNYFTKTYDELSSLSITQRFIIENILNFGIKGNRRINPFEYSYIQALALYLISISHLSDFSYIGLMEYTVNIKEFYKFDEIRTNSLFDYDTFKDFGLKSKLQGTRDFYKHILSISEIDQVNIDHPEEERILIENLENSFQSQFSFNFTNMMRLLWILSSADYSGKDISLFPIIISDKEDLICQIKIEFDKYYIDRPTFTGKKIKKIDDQEIQSILDFISLDFDTYQNEDMLFYLRSMKKKNKLAICPLVKTNGQLLFGREWCYASFQLWVRNIIAGNFPYKIDDQSEVAIALKDIHNLRDKYFEEECGNIAKEVLGDENVIIRLKNFKRISNILPRNPECGEIDLLAVNPEIKTFFIMEVKNYYPKIHPYDIKNEINRFIKNNKSDMKKLQKKEKFVIDNFNLFLDFFQIKDKHNWIFKKGFIVNYNFASAYVKDINVDFVFYDELDSYFRVS